MSHFFVQTCLLKLLFSVFLSFYFHISWHGMVCHIFIVEFISLLKVGLHFSSSCKSTNISHYFFLSFSMQGAIPPIKFVLSLKKWMMQFNVSDRSIIMQLKLFKSSCCLADFERCSSILFWLNDKFGFAEDLMPNILNRSWYEVIHVLTLKAFSSLSLLFQIDLCQYSINSHSIRRLFSTPNICSIFNFFLI